MILGFGFLAAAFLVTSFGQEETRLVDAHWTCEPPDERTGDVRCRTEAPRAVKLELGPFMYVICLAATGIGFLVAAAAVAPRGAGSGAAAPPPVPTGSGPVPPGQPFAPPGPQRSGPGPSPGPHPGRWQG